MEKPVLLVTRRMPQAVEARAAHDYEARLTASDTPIPDLLARAQGTDAILTCPGDVFNAALIGKLPDSVKVIATFSVGHDHIDVTEANGRGIAVCNTPDVLSLATAETALLLILTASRRAGEGERMIRARRWHGWAPTQLLGVGAEFIKDALRQLTAGRSASVPNVSLSEKAVKSAGFGNLVNLARSNG